MEAASTKLSLTDPVQVRSGLRSASPSTTAAAMGLPSNGLGGGISSSDALLSRGDASGLSSSSSSSAQLHGVDIASPSEIKSGLFKLSPDTLIGQELATDAQCQCGAQQEGQAYHYRRLLLLHLQVIERQQALLQVKDAEIETLQADKEKVSTWWSTHGCLSLRCSCDECLSWQSSCGAAFPVYAFVVQYTYVCWMCLCRISRSKCPESQLRA